MSFTTLRFLPALLVGGLLATPSLAQCPTGDDIFEDNDDCFTAATVPTGLTSGLVLYGAAGGSTLDLDWFTLGATQLLAGEAIRIEVIVTNGVANVDIDLYRDSLQVPAACDSATDGGTTAGSTTDFGSANPIHNYTNTSGLDQYVSWRVDPYPSTTSLDCAEYDMIVTIIPAPCAGPDDAFEENDSCAAAVAFPASGTIGLQVHGSLYSTGLDSDFYSLTVAPSDRLEIDLSFTDSVENIDAFLYDVSGGCPGVQLDSGITTSNNESLQWDNTTGVAVPVVLEVLAGDTATSCNEYILTWSTSLSPCAQADDGLEDNDDCANAVPLPLGTTTGLWVFGDACTPDDDFYSYTLADGDRLSVTTTFSDVIGDIDLYMYAVVGCPGTQVASATTTTDDETIYYDNLSGGPVNVVLEVRADLSTFESNTYDMTASVGTSPCAADDSFEDNDDCTTAAPITPGSYTGLKYFYNGSTTLQDYDYYEIDVLPLDTLVTDIYLNAALGDLDIDYYDKTAGCPGTLEGTTTGLNSDQVTHTWINDTGATATIAIRIDRYLDTFLCQDYDMDVTIVPNTCIGDDVYEENDDCLTAALLPGAGSYPGLRYYYNGSTTLDDEDWYEVVVPGGNEMVATVTHVSASGALDIDCYDNCGSSLTGTQTGTSTDVVVLTVANLGSSHSFFLRVDRQTGTFICNDYDLDIAFNPITDPCIGTDDVFEDNDTCLTAVPAPLGLTTGLRAIDTDEDYYSITVPDGLTLNVDILFIDVDGDIDAGLKDVAACGTTSNLDTSGTTSDNENLNWTNTTGVDVPVVIRVFMWANGLCNDYALDVSFSGPSSTVFCYGDGSDGGTCPCGNAAVLGTDEGCLNGTGLGALLTVAGNASVSADTVVLTVSQAVPNDFGIFVQNVTTQATPFAFYNGLLCLTVDSHLVRHYSGTVPATFTDPTGMGINSTPLSVGDFLGDTQPGVTVYYQFWGRDNAGFGATCTQGANFSSGLSVTWLP